MADTQTVVVEFKGDTSDLNKSLDGIGDSAQKTTQEITKTTEQTKISKSEAREYFRDFRGGAELASGSIRGLREAMTASGIGAFIIAAGALFEILKGFEPVKEIFNGITDSLGLTSHEFEKQTKIMKENNDALLKTMDYENQLAILRGADAKEQLQNLENYHNKIIELAEKDIAEIKKHDLEQKITKRGWIIAAVTGNNIALQSSLTADMIERQSKKELSDKNKDLVKEQEKTILDSEREIEKAKAKFNKDEGEQYKKKAEDEIKLEEKRKVEILKLQNEIDLAKTSGKNQELLKLQQQYSAEYEAARGDKEKQKLLLIKYDLDVKNIDDKYDKEKAAADKKKRDAEFAAKTKEFDEALKQEQTHIKQLEKLNETDHKNHAISDKQYLQQKRILLTMAAQGDKTELLQVEKDMYAEEQALRLADLENQTALTNAQLDVMSQLGNFMSQVAGNNKELAIMGIMVSKAAAIGQIITNIAIANAKTLAQMGPIAAIPFIALNVASGAIGVATAIAEGAKAVSQIESQSAPEALSAPKLAMGGFVSGPGHQSGGVPTIMEGNEFVINKGAMKNPTVSAQAQMLNEGNPIGMDPKIFAAALAAEIRNAPLQAQVIEQQLTLKQKKVAFRNNQFKYIYK